MPSAVIIVAVAGLAAFSISIVYNLCFHPLAKFPGPRLAAATHWYEAYFELVHKGGSQFAPKVRQLHAQYGPIIRINPDEISVNDGEFHDRLYAPQPAIRDRHPNFSSALGTSNGSFSSVDHFLHKRRRVAYSPFFSTANVMATEAMVHKKVNYCCDLLWESRDSSPNLRSHFAAISFDSFYTWAFGHSLDLLDDLPMAQKCSDTVELLVTSAPFYRIFPAIMGCARKVPHSILRLLSHHIGRVFDLHTLIYQAAEQFVQSQELHSSGKSEKVSPVEKQDTETLFSVICRSKAPESEKTASRISQEGTEMFMASFTPGRTMMLSMYYLHAYPHVLQSLRRELDEANPDPRKDISYETLNTLPYLKAVMKEIYRVTFPVGSRLPMTCHEDMEFGDWKIPAHSSISVNHRNLLFNSDIFPEPFEFRPERWLDVENPINEKRYFVAFGKGGRGCPGKEFATQVIQLTLCTLVQRFTFELGKTDFAKDIVPSRESILIAPAFASKGVKLKITGMRT
ncbi:Cytochrome P450 [Geosmithia morbida]|uniref:Cytochrome P450 n=1 Tax=Geosmithia morbida TaxID=1094350 RepID=A0A9P5D0S5_9HYPO|nr:Cytochrome P450 [Geosmithia morbida]KAF4121952.1 Cytochrome P450 [Geosmithia morbida]